MKHLVILSIFSLLFFSEGVCADNAALDRRLDSLWNVFNTSTSLKTKITALTKISWTLEEKSNPSEQYKVLIKALTLAQNNKNDTLIADVCYTLSVFHNRREQHTESVAHAKKALDIYTIISDNKGIGAASHRLGLAYFSLNKLDSAEFYLKLSLDTRTKIGNKYAIAASSNAFGLVCLSSDSLQKADTLFRTAFNLWTEINDLEGVAIAAGNLAGIHQRNANYDSAVFYYNASLNASKVSNSYFFLKETSLDLANLYEQINKPDSALKYFKLHLTVKDTLFNKESQGKIIEMQEQFSSLEKENKILEQSLTIKTQSNQKKILLFIAIGAFLIILMVVFFLYRIRLKNQTLLIQKVLIEEKNEELNQQNEEINAISEHIKEQNDLLQTRNSEIIDSINYALKIQNSILPSLDILDKNTSEYFCVFKPKEIVSGDFYWFHETPEKFIWAVADCTGHGVPGALMSMLGISLLNEIVAESGITNSAEILENLRKRIIKSLDQKSGADEQKDGMDIALCVLDKKSKMLSFSGAYNPLILVRNNQLLEYKSDRMPIGKFNSTLSPFSTTEIQVLENDVFYIYSDGFQDQFGGQRGKKFNSKRLKELLLMLHKKPLSLQKDLLINSFDNWKENLEQVDDICIVGVKV